MTEAAAWRVVSRAILFTLAVLIGLWLLGQLTSVIVRIVLATRNPAELKLGLESYVQFGASPRASIYLSAVARCYAFLQGRAFVTPQDVKSIGMDVLRHRVFVTYEAEAAEITAEDVIQRIFDHLPVP